MRKIGELEVSEVGLGCNNFGRRVDLEGTRAVVDAALEAGVNFLDTAESYGTPAGASEDLLGQALEGRRDQVVIATKFGWDGGGSAEYIRKAVEGSLERLRTDVIDLYQYHRPDGETPIEETLGAERAGRRGQGPSDRLLELQRGANGRGRRGGRARGLRGVRVARRTSTRC